MLAITKCMDDLSIYALAKASHRWRQLINSTVDWKQFIRTRWPLFPLSDDENGTNLSRIYDQLSVCTRQRRATRAPRDSLWDVPPRSVSRISF